MENEQNKLTVMLYFDDEKPVDKDGNTIESVEVDVSDLTASVQVKINNIIDMFKLPKTNGIGEPNMYKLIGCIGGKYQILDSEKRFRDYEIKSGDELRLFIDITPA